MCRGSKYIKEFMNNWGQNNSAAETLLQIYTSLIHQMQYSQNEEFNQLLGPRRIYPYLAFFAFQTNESDGTKFV